MLSTAFTWSSFITSSATSPIPPRRNNPVTCVYCISGVAPVHNDKHGGGPIVERGGEGGRGVLLKRIRSGYPLLPKEEEGACCSPPTPGSQHEIAHQGPKPSRVRPGPRDTSSICLPRSLVKLPRPASQSSHASCLQAELGAAPVAALGVVLDGVVGAQTDPLRDRAVLLGLLGEDALGTEGLVRRLHIVAQNMTS
ncbi:hypothetical protein ON010_g2004 [Phytophthora cinnamomi]|nr:hypothetical protein ON010_g2004 [Phytophthora cinnamomi]